jgi:hypothetical protein
MKEHYRSNYRGKERLVNNIEDIQRYRITEISSGFAQPAIRAQEPKLVNPL